MIKGDIAEPVGVGWGKCPTTEALSFKFYSIAANFLYSCAMIQYFYSKDNC